MKITKVKYFFDIPDDATGVFEDEKGTRWQLLNDKRHRLNGPAVEWADGGKSWYVNDKLHRIGGPAIEWASGRKSWYLKGEKLTEEEHFKRTRWIRSKLGKLILEKEEK